MADRPATRGVAALTLALALLATIGITPVSAGTYVRDVYFRGGYERQIDSRTCTAASTAMMLNFIARKDLNLDQAYILRWERTHDALKDSVQKGSDPLGWSRAMTAFSIRTGRYFTYRWESHSNEMAALKQAARAIAVTGMPVGLLVRHGKHAVVMTGFEASSDPRAGDFTLHHVWISDPYGSSHAKYTAVDSPLDRYLELDATDDYDRAWYGKFVIVTRAV